MRNVALVLLFVGTLIASGIAKASPDAPALWLMPIVLMGVFGAIWVNRKR